MEEVFKLLVQSTYFYKYVNIFFFLPNQFQSFFVFVEIFPFHLFIQNHFYFCKFSNNVFSFISVSPYYCSEDGSEDSALLCLDRTPAL